MKKLYRLLYLVLISLFVQFVALFFINTYLEHPNEIKMYEIAAAGTDIFGKPETVTGIKISADAAGIKVSPDGTYICFIQAGKLIIEKIFGEKKGKRILVAEGGKDIFYRWLPDRNMLIYATSFERGNKTDITMLTVDADTGINRSFPKLQDLTAGSRISQVELSPLTNIVYLVVDNGIDKRVLYKFNIINNLEITLSNLDKNTVIKQSNYSDRLVGKDGRDRLFILDGINASKKYLEFSDRMTLIEIDSNDIVYAGKLNKDGKVEKILSADIARLPGQQWKETTLRTPCFPDRLYISTDGELYQLSQDGGMLNTQDGRFGIKLDGSLLCILKDYAVALSGGNLKFIALQWRDAAQLGKD